MKKYEIPEGATHFIESNEEEMDHFVIADEVGNVAKVYCPDYPNLGWDSEIEPSDLPVRALPIAHYITITDMCDVLEDINLKTRKSFVSLLKSRLRGEQCETEKQDEEEGKLAQRFEDDESMTLGEYEEELRKIEQQYGDRQ